MLRGIVFDLDGVVYRGAGGIPGVAEEIARLQKKTRVLFLTNNATRSRADYVGYLAMFGIIVKPGDVMTSSFGTAHYVREEYGRGKRVFVIGEQGLKDELKLEAGAKLVEGAGAEVVACGLDRHINYAKLEAGLRNLLAGAHFVLANSDPTYPNEGGVSPGSGSIAAPLIVASGRQPDAVIGKPSAYLIDKLLEMHKVKPSEAAFVGDRLEIDIRMANRAGMKSVLVLTGISTRKDLKKAPKSDRPDFVLESAAEVGKTLGI
jgi:HAD superfamily hydrolase (TIGR01450 family)